MLTRIDAYLEEIVDNLSSISGATAGDITPIGMEG